MAKDKKRISEFQKALLNNIEGVIKKEKAQLLRQKISPGEIATPVSETVQAQGQLVVNPVLLERFRMFAERHQLELVPCIETALEHFLSLESFWFAADAEEGKNQAGGGER